MSFDLKRFLRKLPRQALREYLLSAPTNPGDDVDWEADDHGYLASATTAISDLPDKRLEIVWSDFENADLLGKDDYGRNAMRSVIQCSEARLQFDGLDDTRACALWLAQRNRALFDKALAAHYADRHFNGKSWAAFALDGAYYLTMGTRPRERFEQRLTQAMNLTSANGRLRVDWFKRQIQEPDANSLRQVAQAAIYREEPPRSELAFDDRNEITSRVSRPVAEAALVFDKDSGDIDVVCKGGKKVQEQLCRIFCETMLGADTPPALRPRPPISFRPLMSRPVFDIRPEDRVRAVEVERLRLRSDRAGGLCVTLESKRSGNGASGSDLYDQARQAFGERSPVGRPGWRIDHARLRVYFEPEGDRRPISAAFDLYAPNRCNLREQTEQHRLILRELLSRWGFYENAP